MELGDIQGWIEAFSYPAVLLLLVSAGFGAPVSEDLILLAGGIATAAGRGSFPLMALAAWLGVVAGDSILFRIGQKLGPRAANARFLRKVLSPERIRWVNGHFSRRGILTIVVVRFCAGLRAPTFVSAGMSGMPFGRFFAADAIAAAIYAPLLVWVGFRFGAAALKDVQSTMTWVALAAIAAAVALIAAHLIRRRRLERSTPAALRRAFGEGVRAREAEDTL